MASAIARSNVIQKMENSGNEAKKYLKTKKVSFSNAADSAHFVRKLARKRAKTGDSAQTKRSWGGASLCPESDKLSATQAPRQSCWGRSRRAPSIFSNRPRCETSGIALTSR